MAKGKSGGMSRFSCGGEPSSSSSRMRTFAGDVQSNRSGKERDTSLRCGSGYGR